MLAQHGDPWVIDCVPLKLRELIHKNKKVAQFDMIAILIAIKKLEYIDQLKNKLQLVDLMSGYRLLKES